MNSYSSRDWPIVKIIIRQHIDKDVATKAISYNEDFSVDVLGD